MIEMYYQHDKCPLWESSHSNGQTKQKSLTEHQFDNEYQTQSLSGMCNQHTPLRKWNVDTLHQEGSKIYSFHLRCLRQILGIIWQDRILNTTVLQKAKCSSIHALLSQRHLRWLGHICMIGKGRIPKDLLFGELENGTRKKLAAHSFTSNMFARGIWSLQPLT